MAYVPPNVQPSGTTFSQFQAGGTSGQVDRLIAANSSSTNNPSAAAIVSATGGGTTGGALSAGTYYLTFTEVNGLGETLPSPESAQFTVSSQLSPATAPLINTTAGGSTGGKLAAGAYYAKYTWIDSSNNGETLGSPESSQFTIAAGNIPQVTLSPLPSWASAANIYLTPANGASGTELLYASGVTGVTYSLALARSIASTAAVPITNGTSTNILQITFPALQPGNIARNIYLTTAGGMSGSELLYIRGVTSTTYGLALTAPTSSLATAAPKRNTTGWTSRTYEMVRAVKDGNLNAVYTRLRQAIYEYNRGTPAAQADVLAEVTKTHAVFALLAQLCVEVGTLIEANPGHFISKPTGIGALSSKRVWP